MAERLRLETPVRIRTDDLLITNKLEIPNTGPRPVGEAQQNQGNAAARSLS